MRGKRKIMWLVLSGKVKANPSGLTGVSSPMDVAARAALRRCSG